jgi:hypothetical protein
MDRDVLAVLSLRLKMVLIHSPYGFCEEWRA